MTTCFKVTSGFDRSLDGRTSHTQASGKLAIDSEIANIDSVDIYISLGSNIEPARNIMNARDCLFSWLHSAKMSPVYQSAAVGMKGSDFYNAVVYGSTTKSLQSVVDKLHEIETEHGRIRTANKFTDRTLDLDLLMYGSRVSQTESCRATDGTSPDPVTLPHPEITQQAYVLQPLADLAGDLVHPSCDCTISEILRTSQSATPEKFQALTPITIGF